MKKTFAILLLAAIGLILSQDVIAAPAQDNAPYTTGLTQHGRQEFEKIQSAVEQTPENLRITFNQYNRALLSRFVPGTDSSFVEGVRTNQFGDVVTFKYIAPSLLPGAALSFREYKDTSIRQIQGSKEEGNYLERTEHFTVVKIGDQFYRKETWDERKVQAAGLSLQIILGNTGLLLNRTRDGVFWPVTVNFADLELKGEVINVDPGAAGFEFTIHSVFENQVYEHLVQIKDGGPAEVRSSDVLSEREVRDYGFFAEQTTYLGDPKRVKPVCRQWVRNAKKFWGDQWEQNVPAICKTKS